MGEVVYARRAQAPIFAAAGSGLVATNFDDHHEQIACKQFNEIDERTFGNATALTLDQFRTLSRGPKVGDKTLEEALESTRLTTKKVIEIVDPLKELVKEHVVSSACCPVWVMKVEAACDAHPDARLGVLLGHAID